MTKTKVELFVLGNLLYVLNPLLEPLSDPQNGNDSRSILLTDVSLITPQYKKLYSAKKEIEKILSILNVKGLGINRICVQSLEQLLE